MLSSSFNNLSSISLSPTTEETTIHTRLICFKKSIIRTIYTPWHFFIQNISAIDFLYTSRSVISRRLVMFIFYLYIFLRSIRVQDHPVSPEQWRCENDSLHLIVCSIRYVSYCERSRVFTPIRLVFSLL